MQIREPIITTDGADWPVDLESGCRALVTTSVDQDELRIQRVTFECPGGEPTTSTFRELKLGEFRLRVVERFKADPALLMGSEDFFAEEFAGIETGARQRAGHLARRLRKGPKTGRGAKDPDFYRTTAQMYLMLYPEHRQRVISAMAEKMGKSPNTVSTWVRRSREEGWLSGGVQGKAGGEPGPKLVEWMNGS